MTAEHSHIFLRGAQKTEEFTTPRGGGPQKSIPQRDRQLHSAKLQGQWTAIWTKAREQKEFRTVVSMPTSDGVYIEFEGAAGHELVTKSLEDRRAGIRLLNVYTVSSESNPMQEITRATLFIPLGKQDHFLKKIDEYAQKETKKGNPKHAALVQSVEDIRLAVLESFWRDDLRLLPQGTTAVWCEIWLRETGDDVEQRFRGDCFHLGF